MNNNERDSSLLSDVPWHFKDLKDKLTIALPESLLQKQEENDVITFTENHNYVLLQTNSCYNKYAKPQVPWK